MLTKYREDFIHPSHEYGPMPFWFWNDTLSKEEIERQMRAFLEKGVHGFVIHPRIGIPNELEYLSDEFMDYVKFAVELAAELNMQVILYDEAMYPSGSAHGKVVAENEDYASKGLRMSNSDYLEDKEELVAAVDVHDESNERMIADGDVKEGYTRYYFIMTNSEGTIRGIHFGEDDNEANAPKSTDLLNPNAIQTFIRLTHERYYECLSQYFGNTIIAMFTDEPMILGRCHKKGIVEWTYDFLDYYLANGGKVIDLPLIFEKGTEEKALFKKIVNKRISESYYEPICTWCRLHNIKQTGHPEKSDDIGFLKYFDLPCQDIVWRFISPEGDKGIVGEHSTMGKCSSDAARHYGKERNGNECFGCCGAADDPFRFTRDDMKWYLDWLFLRGVNLIIPHAFFYSMRDDRKNERPPDVGMNSVFWNEYNEISDYIKRMSQILTASVNHTEIAILCNEDKLSHEMAKALYENQIEFNYLEEDLLLQCDLKEKQLLIAKQSYKVVITDGNIGDAAKSYLEFFAANGGIVIHYQDDITLVEALVQLHDTKAIQAKDLSTSSCEAKLRKTHVKKDEVSFILVSNEGEETIETTLTFGLNQLVEVWDPQTGHILQLENPSSSYELNLPRRTAYILVLQ